MRKRQKGHFFQRLFSKKARFPLNGHLEFTYRCNLNCIHCYCKGSEDKKRELTTKDWKKIIDEIHKEGCLCLCFTGGDPLIRGDFLDIYSYAKTKGFIITIFSNGQAFTGEIIDYLVKSPPFSIEITLNGITKDTYESVTQIPGSFLKVMETINILKERKLPLIFKTNCLKQNKYEIGKIKAFTDGFLGKPPKDNYHFGYDPLICPRLNGDKTPCNYRLSFEELQELRKQDFDIWKEYQRDLHMDFPDLKRDISFLYNCNSWMNQFIINPYGKLKFCIYSDKFSVDLKTNAFREGFYNVFPLVLSERFKPSSKCRSCRLRPICYYCPARAYLESGDEEAPIEYYCELAKGMSRQIQVSRLT